MKCVASTMSMPTGRHGAVDSFNVCGRDTRPKTSLGQLLTHIIDKDPRKPQKSNAWAPTMSSAQWSAPNQTLSASLGASKLPQLHRLLTSATFHIGPVTISPSSHSATLDENGNPR